MKGLCGLIVGAMLGLSSVAQANISIKITRGIEERLSIAVLPLDRRLVADMPVDISEIISNNLERSGYFSLPAPKEFLQQFAAFDDIDFNSWRGLGIENLIFGSVKLSDEVLYEVELRLMDIYTGKQLLAWSVSIEADQLRQAAHQASDLIFKKLTGIDGAFNTHIAYIAVTKNDAGSKIYTLNIADSDGYDPEVIVRSDKPLLSPTWSEDGLSIAYVSFEENRSGIYTQELSTARRSKIFSFAGLNSSPSFSPDGQQLALTLSKDGNAEIYLFDLKKNKLKRITNNNVIDTEPAWSPDGRYLAFTSNRGGSPQIYELDLESGNQPRRISFQGNYNTSAVYSADGAYMGLVHGLGGAYHIGIIDLDRDRRSDHIQILTHTGLNESPSFAPNSNMIIYATIDGNQGRLATVSVDGQVQQELSLDGSGDVREPVWGPSLN